MDVNVGNCMIENGVCFDGREVLGWPRSDIICEKTVGVGCVPLNTAEL